MTNRTTNQLAGLISKRHERLTQLRDLGRRQTELISSGEIAALLRLLSVKQQLIAAVQTIENELAPFHQDDPDQRDWPSQDAREQCAAQAAECRTLIDEIMQIEKSNEQQMLVRQREVSNQLQTVNAQRNARNAYGLAASHASASHGGLHSRSQPHGSEPRQSGIDLAT